MYEYLPIEQAQVGDIVECIENNGHTFTAGRLYQIREVNDDYNNLGIVKDDSGSKTNGWVHKNFKLIKTKPGHKAQIEDTVFCIKNTTGSCKQGDSFIVYDIDGNYLSPPPGILFNGLMSKENWVWLKEYFVVLCKKKEQQTLRRNLAFYKRSGTPWTQEEYQNIVKYCGYKTDARISHYKHDTYIFDNCNPTNFMYAWVSQINFKNCREVAYEDIFSNEPNIIQEFDKVFGIPNTQNACYEVPLVAEEPIKSQSKENTMNDLQQILSQIFGAEKPTTDYDKRPQLLVVVYSLDGKKVATSTANSVEQVAYEVKRNPQLWGCKVLTYKLNKELFVDVPVSIEKAYIDPEA